MLIETAGIADAAEILALQKLAYATEAELYGDWSLPPLMQTLPEIQAQFAGHVFLKACQGATLVGSVRAAMEDGVCQVGRLIVHPAARRQGLGTRLMAEIETRFAQARRFELFTGHRSAGNLSLYQGLGYREFDRRPVNDRLTLVFLQKTNRPSCS